MSRLDDLISRQKAIDAILKLTNCATVRELYEYVQEHNLKGMWSGGINDAIDAVIALASAQPEPGEWVEDERQIHVEKTYHCSKCGYQAWGEYEKTKYCPGCGKYMGGKPGC